MIQIDDAGSGSLIGGTCIGIMRVETSEFYYDIVPLEFYQPDTFKDKAYQDYVIDIVKNAFEELEVRQDEPIQVCRGYMFDKLKSWLKLNSFNWESTKIEDPLQPVVENTFEDYAISLGLPSQYIRYTRYPFHFHRLLKWVYADYDKRHHLCKKGWDSWQKYGNVKREVFITKLSKSNYICLKCGTAITPGSRVKVIQYFTTRPNRIYMHEYC